MIFFLNFKKNNNSLHKFTHMLLLQVCRCISELCRHRPSHSDNMLSECKAHSDIPNPEVGSLLASVRYLVSDFFVHFMTITSAKWLVHMFRSF